MGLGELKGFFGWTLLGSQMGNMLVVTPGKITLAYYHLAIKHPVRNHLLKVTPSKKSPCIIDAQVS